MLSRKSATARLVIVGVVLNSVVMTESAASQEAGQLMSFLLKQGILTKYDSTP